MRARREHDYRLSEPDVLDLDKSWSYLQRLFHTNQSHAAAELVAGNVTHTTTGWISYQGTVAPDRMTALARDLASVTAGQLRSLFQVDGTWVDDRSEEHLDYVSSYLARAVSFTTKVAHENRGIVYYIG